MKQNSASGQVREPLIRMTKRDNVPMSHKILVRAVAIVLALVLDAIFITAVAGLNPLKVYGVMFMASFGGKLRFMWLIRDLVTLLIVGVALAPAFKMHFWNIGAEGQILMGGLMSACCMIYFGKAMPNWLLLLVMLVTSVLCGALWAFIPAFFKANWGTNETLFTLMMNYIATSIVACCTNIFRGQASSLGSINMGTKAGWFPSIFGARYTINVLVVALFTVLMYIYLKYSKHGYELSVVGESENTARYVGINVKKVIMRTMLLSGALCGVTGLLLVSGTDHTIATNTVGGRGFTAIMVSWLAKFNPAYMILTSLLIVFFQKGAIQISTSLGLNDSFADIITGIIIFFIIGSEFFINYSVKFRSKEAKA